MHNCAKNIGHFSNLNLGQGYWQNNPLTWVTQFSGEFINRPKRLIVFPLLKQPIITELLKKKIKIVQNIFNHEAKLPFSSPYIYYVILSLKLSKSSSLNYEMYQFRHSTFKINQVNFNLKDEGFWKLRKEIDTIHN